MSEKITQKEIDEVLLNRLAVDLQMIKNGEASGMYDIITILTTTVFEYRDIILLVQRQQAEIAELKKKQEITVRGFGNLLADIKLPTEKEND